MADYALGTTTDEAQRLLRQSEYLTPHTRRTLQAAGVGPGARVLDLGAGMGDVSLIAAELGATVVAVEREPTTVERARPRLAGHPIQLVQGSVPDLEVEGKFDVICGRLILMYLPDPAAALRQLAARFLRPGGAIAFIEYDFRAARTLPNPTLARRSVETICRVFEAVRCQTDLGLRLPQVFEAAGFQVLGLDALLWTASTDTDIAFDMIAGVLKSLTPLAEKVGLTGELDPDLATLPQRLRAAVRAEGTLLGPIVVGAVARMS